MPDFQWFFDLVKGLGVGGGPVFAVLWWLERTERKDAQKGLNALLVQLLTATNQVTNSITEVTKVVAEVAKDTSDNTIATAQLVKIVHVLSQRRQP